MFTLRPYQQEAVDSTLSHFRRSRDPAVLVLPTGAGKSLIIAELARIARGRVLVLAHVKELVEQNYSKFKHYGLEAGIYSAGLERKDTSQKVIFGSIQSVARAKASFLNEFSLVVIDECHRVSGIGGAQYTEVIQTLLKQNPNLCILGLTATPYRLDSGWIYEAHNDGLIKSTEPKFFKRCVYEVTLKRMIAEGFLTPPVQIDAPVASYDFSNLELPEGQQSYRLEDIEKILSDQARVTPAIIDNICELARDRKGALIFTSTVSHAKQVLSLLPADESALVVGETHNEERDILIEQFKQQKIKYLVNVSVLTTGFDAPHVDIVAILRPTESISLYQQIVGRGLRLFEGKKDCLVLDYTGVPHDIFHPEIGERKPRADAVAVKVPCPKCKHENDFWGVEDEAGELFEHFGKKCEGAIVSPDSGEIIPCGYRYRFTVCESCNEENDFSASHCSRCGKTLLNDKEKLAHARASTDCHVMQPDSMTFERKQDKKGRERLEIRYYDADAQHLSEVFFFDSAQAYKVFHYNFCRMHTRLPGKNMNVQTLDKALTLKDQFRLPLFVIARKQGKYWRIREKVFFA
ncbi:MAG: DEAD/DEAH box helicase [Bdellovibrionales bacterium]|nr:DEAD/DEAH box helicase [Bdellovibrionales bacterium]